MNMNYLSLSAGDPEQVRVSLTDSIAPVEPFGFQQMEPDSCE